MAHAPLPALSSQWRSGKSIQHGRWHQAIGGMGFGSTVGFLVVKPACWKDTINSTSTGINDPLTQHARRILAQFRQHLRQIGERTFSADQMVQHRIVQ